MRSVTDVELPDVVSGSNEGNARHPPAASQALRLAGRKRRPATYHGDGGSTSFGAMPAKVVSRETAMTCPCGGSRLARAREGDQEARRVGRRRGGVRAATERAVIHRRSLTPQLKSMHGARRTPIRPG